jgi:glycosyltransferase involved in cell wall biosynthesis
VRIALTTVQVPFIRGGAEFLVRGLARALMRERHDVEIVSTPFRFSPASAVMRSVEFWEQEDFARLEGGTVDAVIALKFPTYYLKHPRKIVWLLHQHRAVYELFDSRFGIDPTDPDNIALRASIVDRDTRRLDRVQEVLTISRRVSERLRANNGVASAALYHPPPEAEKLYCADQLPYVYFPSRLESLKRQDLLVRAMACVRSPVAAIFSGSGGCHASLSELIARLGLGSRVRLLGEIGTEEKLAWYANALAVFFGPYDEDYGYVTLEAMLSRKPVITCVDSGGPLEFVAHGETGLVVPPAPEAVADAIDTLYANGRSAAAMGEAGRERYRALGISWDSVVDTLLRPHETHRAAMPLDIRSASTS